MKETVIDGVNLEWTDSSIRIEGESDGETTFFNKKFPTGTVVEIIEYLVENDLTVEDVAVSDNCLKVTNPSAPKARSYPFDDETCAKFARELISYFFFVKDGSDDDDDEEDDD